MIDFEYNYIKARTIWMHNIYPIEAKPTYRNKTTYDIVIADVMNILVISIKLAKVFVFA